MKVSYHTFSQDLCINRFMITYIFILLQRFLAAVGRRLIQGFFFFRRFILSLNFPPVILYSFALASLCSLDAFCLLSGLIEPTLSELSDKTESLLSFCTSIMLTQVAPLNSNGMQPFDPLSEVVK